MQLSNPVALAVRVIWWVCGVFVAGLAVGQTASTVLFDDLAAPGSEALSAQNLRVVGLTLEGPERSFDASLELQRLPVFTSDARVTIQTATGERVESAPRHAYFGGTIEGRPGSRAVLTLLDRGGVRGLVHDGSSWWRIGEVEDKAFGRQRPAARLLKLGLEDKARDFHCANADLPASPDPVATRSGVFPSAEDALPAKGTAATHTARIAFETDQQYLALFGGDTTLAAEYIGDLVAIGSIVYSDEVATSWLVESVNLWTTPDPWNESPGACALYEFGKYWNDNNAGIDRTLAHMLSGRSGGGVAWVGVLCSGPFLVNTAGGGCSFANVSNYGGDYGFTAGITGSFDIDNPAPVWDSVAVLHEIGHNFNSPHTHCYNGLGGSADPIDQCYGVQNGCYSGSPSLPAGCPGTGNNCGTIMSYCHQLPGGVGGNISLGLGTSSPYGVLPGRVPDRMASHVLTQAGANPGCLDHTVADLIFSDSFESGNASAWSARVP